MAIERWWNRASILTAPPSDCTIVCRRDWDHTEFLRRSQLSWPRWIARASIGLTIMAIACLLALRITTGLDLFQFFALVGCGLYSALIVWSWVAIIRNRQLWVVRPGEVTSTVPFMGIVWSRTAEVEWLDRFELRPSARRIGLSPVQFGFNEPHRGFDLALVDLKDNNVAVLGPLTRGEALWMAGIIADVLKDALPKEGQTFARWSVSSDTTTGAAKLMGDRWLDEPVVFLI